jgi:DNA-binding NarL/FixJ family response regulator
MNDRTSIRVLMADDHPVVRAGIVSILSKEPDIRVIG